MTPENKEHFLSKEEFFIAFNCIGDDIYSTIDACKTANEMWIAIERLQQGESLNVQDVKTNLFWEFGKFTSRDGESMESYYSRFYKLMNELTRNNLQVTTMQVNVHFFSTSTRRMGQRFCDGCQEIERIRHLLIYTLFDILKQDRRKEIANKLHRNLCQCLEKDNGFLNKLRGNKTEIPHQVITATKSSGIVWESKDLPVAGTRGNCRQSGSATNRGYSAIMQGIWPLCKVNAGSQGVNSTSRITRKEIDCCCKQDEQGVPLQADAADGLADTDDRDCMIHALEASFQFHGKDSGGLYQRNHSSTERHWNCYKQ
ncbi:hypothetical protein Tco_0066617 [Tanacetum coccineum]